MKVSMTYNPSCGTARNVLALLRERGIEPTVVDYLAQPLDAVQLTALAARLGVPVREVMRTKEAAYTALDLADPGRTDAELIAAIAAHPVLLNRPIVVTPRGALLCRPPERVLELL